MDRLRKSLDPKYLNIAINVERNLFPWCAAETMEVSDGCDETRNRNWEGRMDKVRKYGLLLESGDDVGRGVLSMPYVFESVLRSKEQFFIRSFGSYQMVLEKHIAKVLLDPQWSTFNSSPPLRKELISTISNNEVMVGKVKQLLSDSLSNRKRTTRDELFTLLKYYTLRTTHDKRKVVPLHTKQTEISLAHQKILRTDSSGHLDYSWWRKAPLRTLSSDGSETDVLSPDSARIDEIIVYDDNDDAELNAFNRNRLGVHCNALSFHLWVQFLGFDPMAREHNPTETTFLSISRLDAWLVTGIQVLQEHDIRGGGDKGLSPKHSAPISKRQLCNSFLASTLLFNIGFRVS